MHMQAINIISTEHSALAAVINAMLFLAREIRDRGARPDFALFGAMLSYIDAFPERYHHPKEDQYLFRYLRMRHPASASLLDRLERDHEAGALKIRALEQALLRYQNLGASEFAAFFEALEHYASFHWDHMRREETEVIPLARAHLTADDWKIIDEAFLGHSNPLFGVDVGNRFAALFSRIVNLAPPPIGVGPARG
jgi:branched-chain amino acid transport system ATP-binding protein